MRESARLPGTRWQPLQNAPEERAEAHVALSIQRYAETKVWGQGETKLEARSQGPPQAGYDHSSKQKEQRAQSSPRSSMVLGEQGRQGVSSWLWGWG